MVDSDLIDAIAKLVESNAQLAASVFALAQAITEEDADDPDAEPARYMDGTPINNE